MNFQCPYDFLLSILGARPQAFGRLRLVQQPLDQAMQKHRSRVCRFCRVYRQVGPKWKQLHFDTSVVALPEATGSPAQWITVDTVAVKRQLSAFHKHG